MELNAISTTSSLLKKTDSLSRLAENFDNFLLLLTTQLKNQDPTNPLDSSEFTSQLTGFAGVEQQVATNKHLETLLALQTGSQISSASSFIGKIAEVKNNGILVKQTGDAFFSYELDAPTKATFITIADASGNVVFTSEGQTSSGRHNVTWDGKNNDGVRVPPGTYGVAVTFENDEGNIEEAANLLTAGLVTGVDLTGDTVQLVMEGGILVPYEKVQFVGQAANGSMS